MSRMPLLSLLISGLVLSGVVALPLLWAPAQAGNLSKLNQQLQNKSRMTLPSRLYVGSTNTLVVQGKPGATVLLYASPTAEGAQAPNGIELHVGTNYQQFETRIGDNGVASIPLTLPEELDGKTLFVDAVVYTQTDYTDLTRVELLDGAGLPTADNRVSIMKFNEKGGKGTAFMPAMPGMNPQMMQQIQAISGAHGDKRKQDLLFDGTRTQDRLLDRNSFIKLPGIQGGLQTTP
jgi:hypothetical protein